MCCGLANLSDLLLCCRLLFSCRGRKRSRPDVVGVVGGGLKGLDEEGKMEKKAPSASVHVCVWACVAWLRKISHWGLDRTLSLLIMFIPSLSLPHTPLGVTTWSTVVPPTPPLLLVPHPFLPAPSKPRRPHHLYLWSTPRRLVGAPEQVLTMIKPNLTKKAHAAGRVHSYRCLCKKKKNVYQLVYKAFF